jgi:hypothetical protein
LKQTGLSDASRANAAASIQLLPIQREDAAVLWHHARDDDAWVTPDRHWQTWVAWVEALLAAEVMGWSWLRTVSITGRLAGFVTVRTVEAALLPPETTAVECGTYLLPAWRGLGWNALVKQATIHFARSVAGMAAPPDWCLFVVPEDNHRAIAAFRSLDWSWSMELGPGGSFARFARRKSWEAGRPCVVFGCRAAVLAP